MSYLICHNSYAMPKAGVQGRGTFSVLGKLRKKKPAYMAITTWAIAI